MPGQLVKGRQWSLPPGLAGIVLQLVRGRHPQLVANPHPIRHLAGFVRGYRFDGSGTDVNTDCDVCA